MTPITYIIQNGRRIPINSLDSQASSFGMIAPLESSQTNIVQLFVPDVAAITNIRLALINTGGIVFGTSIFGVDSRAFIDTNVVPESFFEGISDKSSNSPNNISVSNLNRVASEYMYLNVNVPIGQEFIAGTIRYQWLFDYA
jgi:hypothetical protein